MVCMLTKVFVSVSFVCPRYCVRRGNELGDKEISDLFGYVWVYCEAYVMTESVKLAGK